VSRTAEEVNEFRDDTIEHKGAFDMSTHLLSVTAGHEFGWTLRARRLGRRTRLTLVAAAALLGAGTVHAGCADPRAMHSMQPRAKVYAPAHATELHPGPAAKNIVGTWLVTYSTGGTPTAQAFIQWHDDGTEWENINLPIEGGNVCMGSWKAVDVDHVERNHHGWLYTNGVLTGYFNETETTEVHHDGTYTGITHAQFYDLDGNLLMEGSGTSSAVLAAP
jgi:hypothetical protein